jgi:hypothetical protein
MRRQFTAAVAALFLASIVAARAAAAEPVELVVKFPAVQVYREVASSISKAVYTVVATGQSRTYTYKLSKQADVTVVRSDDAGTLVEAVYKKLSASTSGPTASDSYDSAKDQPDASRLAQGLSPLVGAKLKFHYAKSGDIDRVEGFDALWAAHPGAKEKSPFQHSFEDAAAKRSMAALARLLPGKPVDVGQRWGADTTDTISGLTIKKRLKCKLTGVTENQGHRVATISFSEDATADGTSSSSKARYDNMLERLTGSVDFDLTQGWFASGDTDERTKGSVSFVMPDGTTQAEKLAETKSTSFAYRW